MKIKSIIFVLISFLMLSFSGCTKPEVKQRIKLFEDIPIDATN